MDILQLVVVGIIVGSIIGLGAIGLTLTYGVMKFANFAHGDLMTLGMFLALFIVSDLGLGGGKIGPLSFGWGMLPAALFAMVGVAGVALLLDRLVFRPLRGRGSGIITMAVASLGIGIGVRAVVQMIWGSSPTRYSTGINKAVTIAGEIKVQPDQFLIVALTLVLSVAVYLLLYRTSWARRCAPPRTTRPSPRSPASRRRASVAGSGSSAAA